MTSKSNITPADSGSSGYEDILTRLRVATGPDRELDCQIFISTAESPFVSYYPDCVLATMGGFAARVEIDQIEKYTASLDASTSLLRRLLPDSDFFVGWGRQRPDEPSAGAMVFRGMSAVSGELGAGEAPTLPLALLIALFEALQAREGGK